MKLANLTTRREFIRNCGVMTAGLTVPQFLLGTAQSIAAQTGWEAGSVAPLPGFKDNHILVVVQLSGGNDGLNTIIPHGNDDYFKARPKIAVPGGERLRVNDDISFHSSLSGLKGLFDEGKLALIEGVGYPNPNRSHFRSMEIWHTASDSDRNVAEGWIGRYFDNACEGQPNPTSGVFVGGELPQVFAGKKAASVSFAKPDSFGYVGGKAGDDTRSFRALNNEKGDKTDTVDFLRHMTSAAMSSADRIHEVARKTENKGQYPPTDLARNLSTVARMIAGGLGSRIYYTSLGGFDTHAGQLGNHARNLKTFGDAVGAFQSDLRMLGHSDHVTTMVFSEFGRRVGENASGGTDHGTAAPMFVLGDKVNGGLFGQRPSLTDLDNGDLKFTTDFRSVYASVLDQWFTMKPGVVLGKNFGELKLMKA